MNQHAEDASDMTCSEFQARMPELIGSGEDIASHPHLQSCERCAALLADLESIAEAARQLFPVADPPDTLWEHIETAIKSQSDPAEPKTDRVAEGASSDSGLSAESA